MTETDEVAAELLQGVKMVWESDRYDVPLGGHAWYNGEYGQFKVVNFASVLGDGDELRYAFFRPATEAAVLKLLAQRQLFEDMVGHHCSYGVRASFDEKEALDFKGYYGREVARHPYRALTELADDEVEYVGEFEPFVPNPPHLDRGTDQ